MKVNAKSGLTVFTLTTHSQLDAAFIKQGCLLPVVTVLFLYLIPEARRDKTLKKLTQTKIC